MAETTPYLPRDCLQGHQVRKLFAIKRDSSGKLVLRTCEWLQYQRDHQKLPFCRFGPRTILYPRDKIEALIAQAQPKPPTP